MRQLGAAAVLLSLAACAGQPKPQLPIQAHGAPRPSARQPAQTGAAPPPQYPAPSLRDSEALAEIPGWSEDDHAAGLAAFAAGCGVARDAAMRGPCLRARALVGSGGGASDDAAARAFFEREFRAESVTGEGILTAYFAPEYTARNAPGGGYTAPVRPKPGASVLAADPAAPSPRGAGPPSDVLDRVLSDPDKTSQDEQSPALALPRPSVVSQPAAPIPYALLSTGAPVALAGADRAGIETSAAPDALAWMRPEDLFFLQIQGSGTLVFPDGARAKAIYAADNGKPFVAIARPMVAQGLLAPGKASGDNIRAWLAAHAGPQAEAVMRRNPRYVFFALQPDDGRDPAGAAGVPLPAGRSLAVDPSRHAYGELYWIDASAPVLTGATKRYRRLAMALDTGAAIRGEVRADLYIGRGGAAGEEAGRVRHTLRLIRLVPVSGG